MTHEELHAYAQRYVGALLMDKHARDYLRDHGLTALLNHLFGPEPALTEDDAEQIMEYGSKHLQEFCDAIRDAQPGEVDEVLEIYMDGFNKYPPRY